MTVVADAQTTLASLNPLNGEVVGEVPVDLFIGDRFLVKLMAEHTEIGTQPRSELRAQLRAADFELGLKYLAERVEAK